MCFHINNDKKVFELISPLTYKGHDTFVIFTFIDKDYWFKYNPYNISVLKQYNYPIWKVSFKLYAHYPATRLQIINQPRLN